MKILTNSFCAKIYSSPNHFLRELLKRSPDLLNRSRIETVLSPNPFAVITPIKSKPLPEIRIESAEGGDYNCTTPTKTSNASTDQSVSDVSIYYTPSCVTPRLVFQVNCFRVWSARSARSARCSLLEIMIFLTFSS